MKIHSFILNYFTNLFILLEFFLVLLRILSFVSPIDSFRSILWANFGNLVLVIPVIVLAVYYEVMIIRNNAEFYAKVKNNARIKLLVIGLLFFHIGAEAIFFQIGIIEIIGDQFPKVISDPNAYEKWIYFGYIAAYMIVPIINYLSLLSFKNSLGVKSELDHNRFKIDVIPAVPYVCIGFIISLVGVTVYNYLIGFLKF